MDIEALKVKVDLLAKDMITMRDLRRSLDHRLGLMSDTISQLQEELKKDEE